LGEISLGEMGLGEMGLGEMGQNPHSAVIKFWGPRSRNKAPNLVTGAPKPQFYTVTADKCAVLGLLGCTRRGTMGRGINPRGKE